MDLFPFKTRFQRVHYSKEKYAEEISKFIQDCGDRLISVTEHHETTYIWSYENKREQPVHKSTGLFSKPERVMKQNYYQEILL